MNNSPGITPNIQAYFSHSYRKDDREVNLAFWKLLHNNGFFFAIDPQSMSQDENEPKKLLNVTYLERLMRSSDCFIAVVPRRKREGSSTYGYSSYIAFESFLAEVAEKPRLVFLESDLQPDAFGDNVHEFNRKLLDDQLNDFTETVEKFADTARNYKTYNKRVARAINTKRAGILLQASMDPAGYSQKTIEIIQNHFGDVIDYSSETIAPSIDSGLQKFLRKVSAYDLVLLDVCDPLVTPELLAIIQIKSIPCIRLAKLGTDETVEKLRSRGILRDYFVGEDSPLIDWKDHDELNKKLKWYLNKFNQAQDRKYFRTYDSGFTYFKSAGRRSAKIFISNPSSLQPIAAKLSRKLLDSGIEHFQYRSNTSIKNGEPWEEALDNLLGSCNIFVAMINRSYQDSENCRHELEFVLEKQKELERQTDGFLMLAYQCADEDRDVPAAIRHIQYADLRGRGEDEIAETMLKQLEDALDKPKPETIEQPESKSPTTTQVSTAKKRILFLASNPAQTQPLLLDEEVRSITQKIRQSEYRDNLELIPHFATRRDDLQQMLLEKKPTIVHFSGHGEEGEIILMDNYRQPQAVPAAKLKDLFEILKGDIRVVLLNACYSVQQAKAISEVIDFVIGMNTAISDDAAIDFSAAFYRALGFGCTIREAYKLGLNAIETSEENTPELMIRKGADDSARIIN